MEGFNDLELARHIFDASVRKEKLFSHLLAEKNNVGVEKWKDMKNRIK